MDEELFTTILRILSSMKNTEKAEVDEKHFSFDNSFKFAETSKLYPYPPIDELVKERDELRKKYNAICNFIDNIADPDSLSYNEMKILEKQKHVISDYIDVLTERLKKIGIS